MSSTGLPAIVAGGALALSLFLTSCGGGTAATAPATSASAPSVAAPSSPSPTGAVSAEHNDVDVTFAQQMIPHHQQAIEMAEIATDRVQRAEVKSLAEQIRTAQGPEITQLIDFLAAWGAEAPAPGAMGGGMDHSGTTGMNGTDMPGMMTDAQMQELRNATGATFDTMFLQMMIEHHRGAVADAQREVDEGSNPEAKQLAATAWPLPRLIIQRFTGVVSRKATTWQVRQTTRVVRRRRAICAAHAGCGRPGRVRSARRRTWCTEMPSVPVQISQRSARSRVTSSL
jgi:uncharacterized protein (DUF305 family)